MVISCFILIDEQSSLVNVAVHFHNHFVNPKQMSAPMSLEK